MKNKIIFCLIFISAFSFSAIAQNKHTDKKDFSKDEEKIKTEKIAFITEKVGFTVKEAQDFWPVFNEQEEKMNLIFQEERSISHDLKNKLSTLSDKEVMEKTDKLIDLKMERSKIEKEYHEKYKSILPVKKISLFYQSEREFKKHLLNKYNCKTEK